MNLTKTTILQAAPSLRFLQYGDEIQAALTGVLEAGTYILGPTVDEFEKAFAQYIGTDYAVGVNSGTDAITLALKALGVGSGDEVLTVSMTATATGIAILRAGARPRFVDVMPQNRCMDPSGLGSAMTSRVRAIVSVHLHGNPAPMGEIMDFARQHGLWVVEDCAQAHGAQLGDRCLGSIGHAAAFSFYPTKNLGCMGDGGAVVTSLRDVADEVRRLRAYGMSSNGVCRHEGINSRLDEMQASVLNVLLPHLDESNAKRRTAARRYDEAFADLPMRLLPRVEGAVYHQYVIEVENRDGLQRWLKDQGIETSVHFATGLHEQPLFQCESQPLPVTETLSRTCLSLPIQPELMHHQEIIIEAVRQGISRA